MHGDSLLKAGDRITYDPASQGMRFRNGNDEDLAHGLGGPGDALLRTPPMNGWQFNKICRLVAAACGMGVVTNFKRVPWYGIFRPGSPEAKPPLRPGDVVSYDVLTRIFTFDRHGDVMAAGDVDLGQPLFTAVCQVLGAALNLQDLPMGGVTSRSCRFIAKP